MAPRRGGAAGLSGRAAETREGLIRRVFNRCDKTERLYRVEAAIFADCTGDCRLALEAGADLRRGREAKAEFGETLAVDQADDHTLGSTILSAYLFASPIGVLLGGWLADRTRRHDLVAATCFLSIAATIYAVAAVELPLVAIGVLFAIAGLASGVVAPSRDMMIRNLTPPGESGKVFGFVTSGYNIAGMVGPPAFGYLLDTADPRLIFWAVVALSLATLCAALVTGAQKGQ